MKKARILLQANFGVTSGKGNIVILLTNAIYTIYPHTI